LLGAPPVASRDAATRYNLTEHALITPAFKPKRVAEGTKQWQLKQYAQATLVSYVALDALWRRTQPGSDQLTFQGSGNLRTAVQLPEGEDLQEWIAVHGPSTLWPAGRLHGSRSRLTGSRGLFQSC
jgi:MOB kinase activator 1